MAGNKFLPGLKYYSPKELVMRVLWNFFGAFIFKIIPRHFYGIRNSILRLFGAKVGKRVKLFPSVKIFQPWMIEIGDDSVVSWNVQLYNIRKIILGKHVIISQNCHLCGGSHDYSSKGFELIKSDIIIHDNVWIGADAFIGPNIVIGENVVISSRSVCFQNIKKNTLVGGNPAQPIKGIYRPTLERNSV